MGLLDQIIGGVINSRMGGSGMGGGLGGGGMGGGLGGALGGALGGGRGGGGMSPLMMALMALLASRGMGGGGLGGLLGGMMGGGAPGGGMGGSMGSGMGGMGGGLGGLLESLTRSGHGDVANSWVSSGPNRAIEPHQLADALGPDTINHLERETGMPRNDLLSQLSQVLPDVVDKLTPQGRMPHDEEMSRW